ncbi:helix-turn-helix transcriptional regulator [Streptomyces sp. NPDC006512]|uniref:helix-turn-helix transcriptional regulator n=1 Tax=Streptomyces sp. NPDC006512 TaxID=3154307 RepID=UPI0033B6BAC1
MTTRAPHTTHATRPPSPAPAPAPGTGRRIFRAAALAATVPYLTLKAAWVAGSRIGIPDGSVLLERGPVIVVANGMTLAMDACVILLVFAFTRPWGLRIPAWLLTVPVFVATGLLAPIVAAVRTLAAPPWVARLTDREADVLRLMATGLSNHELSRRLGVGPQTVKTHVASVLAKTGSRDRTQAVIAAYEGGFIMRKG